MVKEKETLKGIRVLVIDDEDVIRNMVTTILEKEGCVVTAVYNGEEAMKHFSTAAYDVVVTDMAMPQKDGVETIIEIRQLHPPVGIVAMSGADVKEHLLRLATAFEADVTVLKPFKAKKIVEAVLKARKKHSDDVIR